MQILANFIAGIHFSLSSSLTFSPCLSPYIYLSFPSILPFYLTSSLPLFSTDRPPQVIGLSRALQLLCQRALLRQALRMWEPGRPRVHADAQLCSHSRLPHSHPSLLCRISQHYRTRHCFCLSLSTYFCLPFVLHSLHPLHRYLTRAASATKLRGEYSRQLPYLRAMGNAAPCLSRRAIRAFFYRC